MTEEELTQLVKSLKWHKSGFDSGKAVLRCETGTVHLSIVPGLLYQSWSLHYYFVSADRDKQSSLREIAVNMPINDEYIQQAVFNACREFLI